MHDINLNELLKYGAKVDDLVSNLSLYDILKNFDALLEHGANLDLDSYDEEDVIMARVYIKREARRR